jgi:hypothetical protein
MVKLFEAVVTRPTGEAFTTMCVVEPGYTTVDNIPAMVAIKYGHDAQVMFAVDQATGVIHRWMRVEVQGSIN